MPAVVGGMLSEAPCEGGILGSKALKCWRFCHICTVGASMPRKHASFSHLPAGPPHPWCLR